MSSSYSHVYLRELRQLIDRHFDLEGVRTLCFDLGVEYDNLLGEGKANKARELVTYLNRQGRLGELVELCEQERPKVAWGEKKVQHGDTGDTKKEGKKATDKPEWGETSTEGLIYVKSGRSDNRVALWERHPDHPEGEIFVAGETIVRAAPTDKVLRKLKEGELVKITSQTGHEEGVEEKRGKEKTGEPEWVEIPAGEFWMGRENDKVRPLHRLYLDTFWIAQTPVTNAQYWLFVQATGYRPPRHWQDGLIPAGLEQHPVVNVSWDDAITYGRWLSQATGKQISLPSEAQWEKAARGDKDKRKYPWGDDFDPQWANTKETNIGHTSPVGSFPGGASPYGVLDMSGNVFEWTRTIWGTGRTKRDYGYPYVAGDGRENLDHQAWRVLRGGSWSDDKGWAGCSVGFKSDPRFGDYRRGVRLVVARI